MLNHRLTNCCNGQRREGCVCGQNERILRAIVAGEPIEPLTAEERAWCIEEADRAGEGSFPAKDAPTSDAALARWVLDAWTDYVRSNVDPDW